MSDALTEPSYGYSFDNENFNSPSFETPEQALSAAQTYGLEQADLAATAYKKSTTEALKDFAIIYISPITLSHNAQCFPDADMIIEHMACQADDIAGEHSNDYPCASEMAQQELTTQLHALLTQWCDKHEITPSFYQVGASTAYGLASGELHQENTNHD
jgi:hypothetical protein